MTERKPPGVSFETWADRQIREAEERGEFANLPGAGKPLAGIDAPYTEQWWVERKMRDENLSYLPPSLALRRDAQDARERAAEARSEAEVRAILTQINARIDEAVRTPLEGPPHRLVPFDVESAVRQWRSARGRTP
ncbi:DnaJ family domain-containing protein [Streptomyces reniochalinae]|uniref:DUF1992 domain-containing protein n=1 Tax=Streptomyces reniochalinae TaxID=2250578 RepID=A0A367EE92_9ACTN|nr:DUF1992 domain-containing protein [Streptomyces reniochalinae]RCG16396.1 DUF1992 domain-containing protein [Streptomyces reniochalinae]